jgi:pantothenate kinase-related protein Tda10
MVPKNSHKKSAKVSKKIIARMNNLVLERILKNLYLRLSQQEKEMMAKVFSSGDKKAKERFIKIYLPNFKLIFEREVKKLEKEIRTELKRMI